MAWTSFLIFFISSFLVGLKIYNKYKTRWCKSNVCLLGKTVIVTGANTGIGYEAALEFAKRGARVILACRNEIKACEARDRIIKKTQNKNVVVKLINMASLKSVKAFAEEVLNTEQRLDILVNNAGVGLLKNKLTEDGLQVLMQVNYFGPVLLTMLLVDLLKKSSPSRIINVSSLLGSRGNLTPENLNSYPGKYFNYYNSKMGNILFTIKLADLLRNSNISVFSLHPGVIDTEIFNKLRGFRKYILDYFLKLYFKTPEEGAQTTLYTALEQGIEKYSGRHFDECSLVETYQVAKDKELVELVWKKTMKLLNCEEEARRLQEL